MQKAVLEFLLFIIEIDYAIPNSVKIEKFFKIIEGLILFFCLNHAIL